MAQDNSFSGLHSSTLKILLKQWDKDIATRFVSSVFSLNKHFIKDAFTLAYEEMVIRKEKESKSISNSKKSLKGLKGQKTIEKIFNDVNSILDSDFIEQIDINQSIENEDEEDDDNKK